MPFREEPVLEFVCSNNKKPFRLKNDIRYISNLGGETIRIIKGFEFDGASIPKVFAPIVGCRHDEKYLKAALVHDKLCLSRELSWRRTHQIFREILIENGVNIIRANTLYSAVFLAGPKWN